ncbi:MAG TPA: GIY-YIG nuclease family protein [Candidatus Paceibacterota bacterium]
MTLKEFTQLNLPDVPGVYTFRDDKNRPMYIGRATSLKSRVRSYFSADLIATRGPRIVDMVTKAHTVTFQEQDSVLEAILLEAALIKRYQPFYNIDARDNKSDQYIVVTEEEWPRVFLARARDLDQQLKDREVPYKIKNKYGPFTEAGLIKEALKILRKMFPFRDKKAVDPRHEAFYRAMGQSPHVGAAENVEAARQEYLATVRRLMMFFEGRKGALQTELKRQMKTAATEMRFEDADRIKRLIYALEHINDISLIKRDLKEGYVDAEGNHKRSFRIEAYDVAHLGGMENVGVMVVSVNGQPDRNEYRKFKISRNKNDDIAGLTEILSRRLNHPEWPYPDFIVVDGSKVQAQHAEAVLAARRLEIPVVAVTKDDRHKAEKLVGNPDITKQYRAEVIEINAEAHRFAITYHRKRRDTSLERMLANRTLRGESPQEPVVQYPDDVPQD